MSKFSNMIFDFSHCYRHGNEDFVWCNCSDISGSRLYCDSGAENVIKDLIRPYGVHGIHFIDSGDYHYITKIMADFVKRPFSMVLIDHHTDMQKSSVIDMLSCGNWARIMLEQNPYLEKLVLVGQEHDDLKKLHLPNVDKVIGVSFEEIKKKKAYDKLKMLNHDTPVYISIDKDVLDEHYAVTNWDQGEMSMGMLEHLLKYLVFDYDIIGIDICGEFSEQNSFVQYQYAENINEKSNEELYQYLKKVFRKRHADVA